MCMQRIGSSNILKVAYDKQSRTMQIVFINRPNWLYTYYDMNIQRYTAFLKAQSKGEYFTRHIKENYKFKKEIHTKHI